MAQSPALIRTAPPAQQAEPPEVKVRKPSEVSIVDLLRDMLINDASDLFLSAGERPCFRISGPLRYMPHYPKLSGADSMRIVYSLLKTTQTKQFEEEKELDLSFSYSGYGRFRMNCYFQRGTISAAIRRLPQEIVPFDQLGLPPEMEIFTNLHHGLVLVTGPTGSGKSTTLASIIDRINEKYAKHIITLEDPIEYVYANKRSFIDQREIYADSKSFKAALKYILRQNPDVVLIGEIRDIETLEAAMTIAETGHLAFGTLHTNSAVQTINRIMDMFPSERVNQGRSQLSMILEGVISQLLLPHVTGKGRVLAYELMRATPAIRNKVRMGKTEQMYSDMQVAAGNGSSTLVASLGSSYKKGLISKEVAFFHCESDRRKELEELIRSFEDEGSVTPPPMTPPPGKEPA